MTNEQFLMITKWQKETFPHATALSKLHHLKEEVNELQADLEGHGKNSHFASLEFADCFLLLFGCANSYGLSYEAICQAIDRKMAINKERKWGTPNENGVVNHIK